MKQLKAFILGMVSIILFIPVLESICEIICTGLEYIKGLVTIPILKMNKGIQELQVDLEKVDDGTAIGFQYYEEEEYDDDFEDKKKK
jgi:hypothetical protein